MKPAPKSENTEDTREVVWSISNSRSVHAIFDIWGPAGLVQATETAPGYGRFIRWQSQELRNLIIDISERDLTCEQRAHFSCNWI